VLRSVHLSPFDREVRRFKAPDTEERQSNFQDRDRLGTANASVRERLMGQAWLPTREKVVNYVEELSFGRRGGETPPVNYDSRCAPDPNLLAGGQSSSHER